MNPKQNLVLTPCGAKALRVRSPNHVYCIFLDFAPEALGVSVGACLSPDEADALADALKTAAVNGRLPDDLETVKRAAEHSRKSYEQEIAKLEKAQAATS